MDKAKNRALIILFGLAGFYIFVRIGIIISFIIRFFLDPYWMQLKEAGSNSPLINMLSWMTINPVFINGFWGSVGLVISISLARKIFRENKKVNP